jgi:hypothetical protein
MNKNETLLLFISTILLFISCNKEIDENGYKITYYKNKTAVGYCYFCHIANDSVWPAINMRVIIESSYTSKGWIFGGEYIKHEDIVYTDEFGKYSFNLVKTIDGKRVLSYVICALTNLGGTNPSACIHIKNDEIGNTKIYNVDTIMWYY